MSPQPDGSFQRDIPITVLYSLLSKSFATYSIDEQHAFLWILHRTAVLGRRLIPENDLPHENRSITISADGNSAFYKMDGFLSRINPSYWHREEAAKGVRNY